MTDRRTNGLVPQNLLVADADADIDIDADADIDVGADADADTEAPSSALAWSNTAMADLGNMPLRIKMST